MEVLRDGKFSLPIKDKELMRGIRRDKNQSRNKNTFASMTGMIGKEGSLVSLPALTAMDTSVITAGFPYPQIFVLSNVIIVCGKTKIYELIAGVLTEMLTVSEGRTWKVIDFFEYVYLSNEMVAVIRNASSRTYSVTTDLPTFSAGCNYNGQVLISAPDVLPYIPVVPTEDKFIITSSGTTTKVFTKINADTAETETVYTSAADGSGNITAAIRLSDDTLLFAGAIISGGSDMYAAVYRSIDDGETWSVINVSLRPDVGSNPSNPWSIRSFVQLSTGTVLALVGTYEDVSDIISNIYSSSDSGATWTLLSSPVMQTKPIMCLGDSDVLIVGTDSSSYGIDEIYRSIDGGENWSIITTGVAGDKILNIVALYHIGNGIIVGGAYTGNAGFVIIRSDNNGVTWSIIDKNTTLKFTAFTQDTDTVYAMTKTGIIASTTDVWVSTDDGATWTLQETSAVNYLYQYPFIYEDTFYGFYYPTVKLFD